MSLPRHLEGFVVLLWSTAQPKPALSGFGTRHLPSPSAWMEFGEMHRGFGTKKRDNGGTMAGTALLSWPEHRAPTCGAREEFPPGLLLNHPGLKKKNKPP